MVDSVSNFSPEMEAKSIEKTSSKRKKKTKEYDSDGDSVDETPKKKKTKSSTPKNPGPRSIPGVSSDDFNSTKFAPVKKLLNNHVRTLAKMVNLDWHDGYEEQGEELSKYFANVKPALQGVVNISVLKGIELERCHEILKLVADTWDNMLAIPMRGSIEDAATENTFNLQYGSKEQGPFPLPTWISIIWRHLLCVGMSTGVPESTMNQYIKDAVDNNTELKEWEEFFEETELVKVQSGVDKLKSLFEKKNWESCPSTKKHHNMRRAIDRRFDGPKHLRTRDFSDSDSEGGGCQTQ